MTDVKLLQKRIHDSGYKVSFIASKIGITGAGFYKKLRNKKGFYSSEIKEISSLLNLTLEDREKIFFKE